MSAAPTEVELKFAADSEALDAALVAAPSGVDETRAFATVYFDTPRRALAQTGASLRIRESDGRRTQTLKIGSGFSRREHEQAVEGWEPDLAMDPLPALLAAFDETLAPAFRLKVDRRLRLIRMGNAEVELALDVGEIATDDRAAPIHELELELKSGPSSALFDLARLLMQSAPLYLSFDGKAAQGHALSGDPPEAATPLAAQMDAAAAFQTLTRRELAEIGRQALALRRGRSVESVHQLRVAVRRLRSHLATFSDLTPGAARKTLAAELKWLAKSLDAARNLDVFAEQVPEAATALLAAVAVARDTAALAAAEAAGSARFRALMLETAASIETGPWLEDVDLRAARETSATAFGVQVLDRRWRRLEKRGRNLGQGDDEARHALRIEAKKMRYAAEAFAALFPESTEFLGRVKAVQTRFGALNDAVTARAVVKDLGLTGQAAKAAKAMITEIKAGHGARRRKADAAFATLAKTPPFWRPAIT